MDPIASILGTSDAARGLREFARRAARVDAPVLLTGESGTGKGVVARAIHAASKRARAPFLAVNCAGIAESLFESEFFGHVRGAFTGAQLSHRGLFEQASGGTLFLDEVAELPTALQAKLLCAIEDGEIRRVGAERPVRVDVRLIAATAADLPRAVAQGRFRRDLFHRLHVLSCHLPPLRERGNDILLLLDHFLDRHRARYGLPITGFDPAARARLLAYPWPGNIRELDHAIEAAILACEGGRIRTCHLGSLDHAGPDSGTAPAATPTGRYSFDGSAEEEAARIRHALDHARGNRTRAARALGMSRNTLRRKLRHLGLDPAP